MARKTAIPWCDATFNPWWGCEKVSAGCKNCYADAFAKRMHPDRKMWGKNAERRVASESYWKKPLKWNRDAERKGARLRVFCGSMCDVFEDREDLVAPRQRLMDLIRVTPNLDWLLLTKRIENAIGIEFPSNVWVGATMEDQKAYDERIMWLARVEAAVRFISMEPLIGPVSLALDGVVPRSIRPSYTPLYEIVNWVIVGAESGPSFRPFERDWARAIRDECEQFNVPFFYKQEVDKRGKKIETPPLDGVVHAAFPNGYLPAD